MSFQASQGIENGFSEGSFLPRLERKLMKHKSSGLSSSGVSVSKGESRLLEVSVVESIESVALLSELAFLLEEERETLSFRLQYSLR